MKAYQYSGALAHDEAIAVLVPRPGSCLGFIVPLRKSPTSNEASEPDRDDRSFGSAGDHHVGLAAANVIRGRVEAVVGRGTGGGDRVVRTHQAEIDREKRRSHVCNRVRDEKRGDFPVPFLNQGFHTIGEDRETAHTSPNEHAGSFLVDLHGRLNRQNYITN